ncbi:MAG: hypothetical protein J6W87_02540, partial [Clostridia bacterium]|nr:hypothetical protein [Clostridia bacterium]
MIFWTENDILKEKAALKKSAILYAEVAAAYLIVSVTLLLTSKGREYFWVMAGDIALSVAFAWGSFWFFTNPFAERKSLIALYGKMTVSEEYVETGVLTDISEITK